MNNPIVDVVRRVREKLISQHGGLEGYLKHCEQQDRRQTRKPTGQGRRKRRCPVASRTNRRKP